MSITPAILSKTILDSLTRQLINQSLFLGRSAVQAASAQTPSNWTLGGFSGRNGRNTLFIIHAAASGALDEYHVEGGTEGVPQVLLGHEAHPFEAGNLRLLRPDNPAFFASWEVRVG